MTVVSEVLKPTRRAFADFPTSLIVLLMICGFPLFGYLQALGRFHPLLSIFLATVLMNFSFTAWHESAHSNFSRYTLMNHVSGWIASLASVYPGYFARRREHLAHHKWEGVAGKDPVYGRIQIDNPWFFPFELMKVNLIDRNPVEIPQSFCPYKTWQRVLDWLSNIMALGICLFAWQKGYGFELLCVWIIPRILVFFLHAYYICFFPHQVKGGGYQVFRVKEGNWMIRLITMGQNFHGIHHRWPFIPWYAYSSKLSANREFLEQNGFEFVK